MANEPNPRYCGKCGEIFDERRTTCPECFARWPQVLPLTRVERHTLVLGEVVDLRQTQDIDEPTFEHLREVYETLLLAERPIRRPARLY
jgi:hypothetical protein